MRVKDGQTCHGTSGIGQGCCYSPHSWMGGVMLGIHGVVKVEVEMSQMRRGNHGGGGPDCAEEKG